MSNSGAGGGPSNKANNTKRENKELKNLLGSIKILRDQKKKSVPVKIYRQKSYVTLLHHEKKNFLEIEKAFKDDVLTKFLNYNNNRDLKNLKNRVYHILNKKVNVTINGPNGKKIARNIKISPGDKQIMQDISISLKKLIRYKFEDLIKTNSVLKTGLVKEIKDLNGKARRDLTNGGNSLLLYKHKWNNKDINSAMSYLSLESLLELVKQKSLMEREDVIPVTYYQNGEQKLLSEKVIKKENSISSQLNNSISSQLNNIEKARVNSQGYPKSNGRSASAAVSSTKGSKFNKLNAPGNGSKNIQNSIQKYKGKFQDNPQQFVKQLHKFEQEARKETSVDKMLNDYKKISQLYREIVTDYKTKITKGKNIEDISEWGIGSINMLVGIGNILYNKISKISNTRKPNKFANNFSQEKCATRTGLGEQHYARLNKRHNRQLRLLLERTNPIALRYINPDTNKSIRNKPSNNRVNKNSYQNIKDEIDYIIWEINRKRLTRCEKAKYIYIVYEKYLKILAAYLEGRWPESKSTWQMMYERYAEEISNSKYINMQQKKNISQKIWKVKKETNNDLNRMGFVKKAVSTATLASTATQMGIKKLTNIYKELNIKPSRQRILNNVNYYMNNEYELNPNSGRTKNYLNKQLLFNIEKDISTANKNTLKLVMDKLNPKNKVLPKRENVSHMTNNQYGEMKKNINEWKKRGNVIQNWVNKRMKKLQENSPKNEVLNVKNATRIQQLSQKDPKNRLLNSVKFLIEGSNVGEKDEKPPWWQFWGGNVPKNSYRSVGRKYIKQNINKANKNTLQKIQKYLNEKATNELLEKPNKTHLKNDVKFVYNELEKRMKQLPKKNNNPNQKKNNNN